jgi:hypothetical protein
MLALAATIELKIVGPVKVHVTGNMMMMGASKVSVVGNGSAEFYVGGATILASTGVFNTSQDPSKAVIYGLATTPGGQTITMSGTSEIHTAIYAPNAALTMANSPTFYGSTVVNSVSISGTVNYHYDENLADFYTDKTGSYKMENWQELISRSERFDYASYSGP